MGGNVMKKKNMRKSYISLNRSDLHKFLETFRIMSCSIMEDDEIIKQYNNLSIAKREKIYNELKKIDTAKKIETADNQFALSIVEIHMVSGKYGVDPAVAYMSGCADRRKNYRLIEK